jgi:hypothetical protein
VFLTLIQILLKECADDFTVEEELLCHSLSTASNQMQVLTASLLDVLCKDDV